MQVRPTKDLWKRIERNIEALYTKRIEYMQVLTNHGMSLEEINRICYEELITPEEQTIFDTIGPKYFSIAKELEVEIMFDNGRKRDHTIKFPMGRYLPDKLTHYNAHNKVSDPRVSAIAKASYDNVVHVQTERQTFMTTAKSVFDECSSVNTLAKIWPPIMDLLPGDIVDRMNRKVERKTLNTIKNKLDDSMLSNLSGHLLKAKVAK
jgi:DNA-binding transcriptional MerR regulator